MPFTTAGDYEREFLTRELDILVREKEVHVTDHEDRRHKDTLIADALTVNLSTNAAKTWLQIAEQYPKMDPQLNQLGFPSASGYTKLEETVGKQIATRAFNLEYEIRARFVVLERRIDNIAYI